MMVGQDKGNYVEIYEGTNSVRTISKQPGDSFRIEGDQIAINSSYDRATMVYDLRTGNFIRSYS